MAMAGAHASNGERNISFDQKLSKTPMLIPPALKKLLSPYQKIDVIDTLEKVLEAAKAYIFHKNLFDPRNPVVIDCSEDELGKVLMVQTFSLTEIKRIILRQLLAANRENYPSLLELLSNDVCKRKKGTSNVCSSLVDKIPTKYLCTDERHRKTPSLSDVIESSTSSCDKDDSSSSDSDISFGSHTHIFAEMFEYEIETENSHSSSCDSFSTTDSEIEDILHVTALTELAASETDDAFLADQSSNDDLSSSESSDDEISNSDKWICKKCHSCNKPTIRFCMKCYKERSEWLSEKNTHSEGKAKERRRKKKKNHPHTKSEEMKDEGVSQKDEDKNGATSSLDSNEDAMCIICCSRRKNGVVIHGQSGHNVCCFTCAKKLYKKNGRNPCPICRRPIDRVIYLC